MARKRKSQQIGSIKRIGRFLGNKATNEFLDNIHSTEAAEFYIQKLREAYENTKQVEHVVYSNEEKTILQLLRGEVNGLRLDDTITQEDNIIYIFNTPKIDYIIVINRFHPVWETTNKVTKDIQTIYHTVESHMKNTTKIPEIKVSKRKETVVGSFGYSSHLAEKIAEKYNFHHIAFNPVLLGRSNAVIFKIRGDPLSLFAYGKSTYEIVRSYTVLDNKASSINNF
jgi:hypothetical protein